MKTSELIASLSGDLKPVSRFTLFWRLSGAVILGAVLSFLMMWAWLGFRPDLAAAVYTPAYWLKFLYTLALACLAYATTARLARPATRADGPALGLLAVIAILVLVAGAQTILTPPAERLALMMGHSSRVCPWRIAIVSLPIFVTTFGGVRALAPTRLMLAGAAAGLAAGALGAWIYAFHCDETSAPFLLVFYTAGIMLVGAVGGLFGKLLLRW